MAQKGDEVGEISVVNGVLGGFGGESEGWEGVVKCSGSEGCCTEIFSGTGTLSVFSDSKNGSMVLRSVAML